MSDFGSNLGYVDELYARYLVDPSSVSPSWRDFFADYRPGRKPEMPSEASEATDGRSGPNSREAGSDEPPPSDSATTGKRQTPPPEGLEPMRGAAARIVENMNSSLAVPTATSVRAIPVKLLEENRRVLNAHQWTVSGPKISFTHLIAYAVVRAIEAHPTLNAAYESFDDRPHRRERGSVRLGIAIDVARGDDRTLLVPNLPDAQTLDFPTFVERYDDLVARARAGRLEVSDFEGTTVTLTNPGMLGTALSVPRLMQGQGAIVGVGAIGYPAEYSGMAPEVIAMLGVSKIMQITSTYDHRVIQGAESGAFLSTIERLLLGEDGFYRRIFRDLAVPQDPLTWSADVNPQGARGNVSADAFVKQAAVVRMIRAYRVRGHLWADLDPLHYAPKPAAELEMASYGLSVWDLDREFSIYDLGGGSGMLPLRDILSTLQRAYCRHVGVEFLHIPDPEQRDWIQERIERREEREAIDLEDRKQILRKLNAAEAFERFLHTTYLGHKRFSLEGAETLIPMLDALLNAAAEAGVEAAYMGMAHRGRLNVLANVIGMSYDRIFRRFEGDVDPDTAHGSGDVIYHLGFEGEHVAPTGRVVRLELASNPSHLEAVDPVVEGMARASQDLAGDTERGSVLPILIHGDAAFAGQGVVAETLNLSQLAGYRTGGTVHIVVNNQIGFTTGPADARSSLYSTDVAKAVHAPIFHVNGDHPEDAVRVIRLALEYRQRFRRDVVVDMVCYRRWGHNETDDPSYTHPTLYEEIENHRSVRKLYTEQLLRRGEFDPEMAEKALDDFRERLRTVHDEVQRALSDARAQSEGELDEREPPRPEDVDTTVDRETLDRVLDALDDVPDGFRVQDKLARQMAKRADRYRDGTVDWATAEALAFGSLVLEGTPVRLSGEDSARGTFSQRHAVLVDPRDGRQHTPLAHLSADQAPFQVYDSLLSEFAVLGFEYGYSVARPDALVMWEAQFGDFNNGAQVIIDQFIVSAEEKWNQKSGVVLLLPHGSEGQGPEHSSARLERFLQLAATGNITVVNPTTPSQYFHLLRRHVRASQRRPLVVMTPKSLLRHRACVSAPDELARGEFREVLDEPRSPSPDGVRRVVFCNGKVYYDLAGALDADDADADRVALVRVEQLYPFPNERLAELGRRYGDAETFVWAQEEPRNMGAWSYFRERVEDHDTFDGRVPRYVGRPRAASPATGSSRRHSEQQDRLVARAIRTGDVES